MILPRIPPGLRLNGPCKIHPRSRCSVLGRKNEDASLSREASLVLGGRSVQVDVEVSGIVLLHINRKTAGFALVVLRGDSGRLAGHHHTAWRGYGNGHFASGNSWRHIGAVPS